MMNRQAAIKSQILQWFDSNNEPVEKRSKLSAGIDLFLREIEERNTWSESMTVLLGDASAPKFRAAGRNWRATACRSGLAVSTFVPGWGFGWSTVFKDEYVYDVLSWLAHYARQYIHRSYVAKVLMIAWERDQVVLHPFGSQMQSRRYEAVTQPTRASAALATAASGFAKDWGTVEAAPKSQSKWLKRNTLEPAIHQAVFHFLRGQSLISEGFDLEAVVAFDCVLQSLQAISWGNSVGDPRRCRADLVTTLGLNEEDSHLAEHLYFLRNEFSAHAGGWRWWDSGEYASSEMLEQISMMTLKTLVSAADAEPVVRRVGVDLKPWSKWFFESFKVLFEAVWFRPEA